MARLSTSLMLLGLLSTSLVAASPEFNQEEQNRNADCDNGCFFGSFPGGSCTDDAACMCTQKKYRERYFCCMGAKCAPSVLIDSIQRQSLGCESRNLEFTFDVEAVCGIKLATTSSIVSAATSTTASGSDGSSATPTSITASASSLLDTTVADSSPAASEASPSGSPTPTTNGAPQRRVILKGVVIMVAVSGVLLW